MLWYIMNSLRQQVPMKNKRATSQSSGLQTSCLSIWVLFYLNLGVFLHTIYNVDVHGFVRSKCLIEP